MSKVSSFIKNHFVEVIGFLAILFIIILISYLKVFKKTFTCELTKKEGKATIYQRYIVKQSNNNLKGINYYYRASTPDKKERKRISDFYNKMIEGNEKEFYDNNITLKFNGETITLSYDINLDVVKDNKVYKNARTYIKNIKSVGFKCK